MFMAAITDEKLSYQSGDKQQVIIIEEVGADNIELKSGQKSTFKMLNVNIRDVSGNSAAGGLNII